MRRRWASVRCSMRSLISAIALRACDLATLIFLHALIGSVCHGAPADIWPVRIESDPVSLAKRAASLDKAAAGLPAALAPAVEFQKVFLRIVGGAPRSDWLRQIRGFTDHADTDAVSLGLRDAGRAWLARVEMQGLDDVLRAYYAENVRFPATLAEVESSIPVILRTDPWGEKWSYNIRAANGFAGIAGQRYQIGPARYPNLGTLREAITARLPPKAAWKITSRKVGENTAFEFKSPGGGMALIQPAGKIDGCTLMFAGSDWLLMAGTDQLFAVTF